MTLLRANRITAGIVPVALAMGLLSGCVTGNRITPASDESATATSQVAAPTTSVDDSAALGALTTVIGALF